MAVAQLQTVSLRLHKNLAKRLERAAKAAGVSKSEFLRQCLSDRLNGETQPRPTAWELGKDLFGCFDSGDGTLSERADEVVRERIHAKYAARRGRR
ncbi:MAG: ribbon-helix-helix protein, CopG family [Planctomycetaceae bacterium]